MTTNNHNDLPQAVREFAGHYALERRAELQQLDSNYQARIADAKWPETIELIKQYCLDRFDHHGEAFLFTSGSSDATSINPAYAQHLETAEEKTVEFLSTALQNYPPDVRQDVTSWVNLKLSSRKLHWLARATKEHLKSHPAPVIDLRSVEELQARVNSRMTPEFVVSSWQDVKISFFNEHSVEITAGSATVIRDFASLGMAHKRSGKPTLAWVTLHELAKANGLISRPTEKSSDWRTVEKRFQELRRWLRRVFNISAEPLPFVKGVGYRAELKIICAPSYQR